MTHGHTAGGKPSRTWRSWRSMYDRCNYPKVRGYDRYGGRGIKICDRWAEFENFLQDMGERPPGMTLDRIDGDGDYGPENCRWADKYQQRLNSHIHWIEYDGERFPMKHLAAKLGIDYATMSKRVEAGWPAERLGEPKRICKRKSLLTPATGLAEIDC